MKVNVGTAASTDCGVIAETYCIPMDNTKSAIQKNTRPFLVRATVANDVPDPSFDFPSGHPDHVDVSISSTASLLAMPFGIDDL